MIRRLLLTSLLVASGSPLAAQSAEQEVVRTVQRTFDAMRTRDTAALRSVFDSTARIVGTSLRNGAPVVRAASVDQFVAAIGRATDTHRTVGCTGPP